MRKFCILLVVFVTAFTISVGAVSLEQVKSDFPMMSLYLHGDGTDLSTLSTENIKATLAGVNITVESFAPSDEPIFYIYMLDISGSIPDQHFLAAKQEILNARRTLRSQDSLAIVAFGDAVQTIVTSGQSLEATEAALTTLEAKDDTTLFYTAMQSLVNLALEAKTTRTVAIVISDGISEAKADMTQTELEAVLRNSGVAVNGLCVDSASEYARKHFKAFLNVSGGDLYPFDPQSAPQVFADLRTRLDESRILRLRADPNLATGDSLPLHIDFATLAVLDTEVTPPKATAVLSKTTPPPPPPVEEETSKGAFFLVGAVFALMILLVWRKRKHTKQSKAPEKEKTTTDVKFIFMDEEKK